MLMSPLSTLKICGISSRLERRRNCPTDVMRGSFFILKTGPVTSLRVSKSARSRSESTAHGTEPVELEQAPAPAHAILAIEYGPFRIEANHQRHHRNDGHQQQQDDRAHDQIKDALGRCVSERFNDVGRRRVDCDGRGGRGRRSRDGVPGRKRKGVSPFMVDLQTQRARTSTVRR